MKKLTEGLINQILKGDISTIKQLQARRRKSEVSSFFLAKVKKNLNKGQVRKYRLSGYRYFELLNPYSLAYTERISRERHCSYCPEDGK
mmetsp:Transcript_10667/g.11616  ORF Transcript_10667/g.11616 Transcript_10667/m.11616 type:complete len:89 (+) Transcript_10667:69-335(+)